MLLRRCSHHLHLNIRRSQIVDIINQISSPLEFRVSSNILLCTNQRSLSSKCYLRRTCSTATYYLANLNNGRTFRKKDFLQKPNSCCETNYLQSSNIFSSLSSPTKKEFSERRIMGFSREQMFSVVSDVENYTKFLPWCESSIVRSRDPSLVVADLVIGMKPVTESYTSRVILRRPSLIIAESRKGRHFNSMITKWRFNPGLKAVPQSCIIDFYVQLEFRSALHANIANVFFNEVVKAMAGAFYEEAKKRYGAESIPSRKITVVSKEDDDV